MTKVPSRRTLVLDGSLGFCVVAIVEQQGGVATCEAEDWSDTEPLLQRINNLLPGEAERAALTMSWWGPALEATAALVWQRQLPLG